MNEQAGGLDVLRVKAKTHVIYTSLSLGRILNVRVGILVPHGCLQRFHS